MGHENTKIRLVVLAAIALKVQFRERILAGNLSVRFPSHKSIHKVGTMQTPIRTLLAASGLVMYSVSLSAQWPDRKAARAPRLLSTATT